MCPARVTEGNTTRVRSEAGRLAPASISTRLIVLAPMLGHEPRAKSGLVKLDSSLDLLWARTAASVLTP
jgi:hypothetical protein